MKHQGGTNTPKTLAELKKEKKLLEARLSQVLGLARETRSQLKHTNSGEKISSEDIREKIADIDLLLDQKSTNKNRMPLTRTPPKSDSVKPSTLQFDPTLPQVTSSIDEFFQSTDDIMAQSDNTNEALGAAAGQPKTLDLNLNLLNPQGITYEAQVTKSLDELNTLKPNFSDFAKKPEKTIGLNIFGQTNVSSVVTDPMTSKIFKQTTPSCVSPSYLPMRPLFAPPNLEEDLRRLKEEQVRMRDLYEQKIKQQEREINSLRSKQANWPEPNYSSGAISKRSDHSVKPHFTAHVTEN